MPCGDSPTVRTPLNEAAARTGDYLIRAACNPPLARRPITADSSTRLQPRNVVIRRGTRSRRTGLEAIGPRVVVQFGTGPDLAGIASDSRPGLRVALASRTADAPR